MHQKISNHVLRLNTCCCHRQLAHLVMCHLTYFDSLSYLTIGDVQLLSYSSHWKRGRLPWQQCYFIVKTPSPTFFWASLELQSTCWQAMPYPLCRLWNPTNMSSVLYEHGINLFSLPNSIIYSPYFLPYNLHDSSLEN